MKNPLIALFTLLLGLAACPLPGAAAADDLKGDLARLQGKWKAKVSADAGESVWTLEIKGNKTTIAIESTDGDLLFKGESEFKLEKHGKFRAYTYFNLKILSGNDEGQTRLTDGETKSSIYKFHDDAFVSLGGFREDDSEAPRLIRWEKQGK